MNGKRELLKRLSAAHFAVVETNLYLDTHPEDKNAIAALKRYSSVCDELRRKYEEKYGPLNAADIFGNNFFEWVNDPWPWEKEMGND